MFSSTLYRISPPWIQSQLISLRAWTRAAMREGRSFRAILSEINETQWYSRAQLDELQLARTRAMVQHAAAHVPYYARLFAECGFDAAKMSSLDDLQGIPLLDKQLVRKFGELLEAQNLKGPRLKVSTSGTSGTPLTLTQNLEAVNRENAFIWRQLQWAGYRAGEPRAWLRGDMVVPFTCDQPPFWRMNAAENMLMLSSYHLAPAHADAYVRVLEKHNPTLIQAYPSSITFLARWLAASGRTFRGQLRAIVTTSESLAPEDRELVERSFNCKVFEQYGSAERVTMFHTCERGRMHVDLDYGYAQFLPTTDGRQEIVATGFNNPMMPLIRYRLGDTAELADPGESCSCGRAFPLVKRVHGRADDYVKTSDGRLIGRLDHIFKGTSNIAEAQIVQETAGEVVIRVVPAPGFSQSDERQLLTNAHERLGSQMKVSVDRVAAIERTSSGKFKAVICRA